MTLNDEKLDLVDLNDMVIGQEWRSEVYRKKMNNYRVINGFLENPAGQIWILRRSPNLSLFPLGLDVSVGGHVKSGETYDAALERELREELFLNARLLNVRLLDYLTPQKDGVSAFTKIYQIQSSITPKFNLEEFIEGFWIDPSELIRRLDHGELAKDDLIILAKKYWGS